MNTSDIMGSMKKKTRKAKSKSTKKAIYRVGNWSAYNKSLVQCGSITLWISEDQPVSLQSHRMIRADHECEVSGMGKPGDLCGPMNG